jgi:hypothetical protein
MPGVHSSRMRSHRGHTVTSALPLRPSSQILASTSRTDAANHLRPPAVGMPRSLRAPSMARSEVAPLACGSVITGARSARARSGGLCISVRALLAGPRGELCASTKATQLLPAATTGSAPSSGAPLLEKGPSPESSRRVERTHLSQRKLSTRYHVANRRRVPLPAARRSDPARV